jgi:hypothetical protein
MDANYWMNSIDMPFAERRVLISDPFPLDADADAYGVRALPALTSSAVDGRDCMSAYKTCGESAPFNSRSALCLLHQVVLALRWS